MPEHSMPAVAQGAGGPDTFHRLTKLFCQKVPQTHCPASSLGAAALSFRVPMASGLATARRSRSRLTTIPRRLPEV